MHNSAVDAWSVLVMSKVEQPGRLIVLYQVKQAITATTTKGSSEHEMWIRKTLKEVKKTLSAALEPRLSASTEDSFLIVIVSVHVLVEDDLREVRQTVSEECGSLPIDVLVMSPSDLQQSMPTLGHRFLFGSADSPTGT
jgi:hypothetical protein